MTSPPRRCGHASFIVGAVAALGVLVPTAQAQQSTAAGGSASQPPSSGAAAASGKPATAKSGAASKAGANSAASYSLGVSMGEQLRASGVRADAVSTERLAQGVRDALSGKVKLSDADRTNIAGLLHSEREAAGEANQRAAAKFLADNGKKPDVVTTASGLEYRVVTQGSGDSPKATDQVIVNYRGKLLDGTEFDSSYRRGQPATFPVNHVIPGWTEALQLMKPGGKYELWLPPHLAYDLTPPPGAPIPPGSMLIFDVELVGIKPPQAPAGTSPGSPPPQPSTSPETSK